MNEPEIHGGDRVAEALLGHGARFVFTLVGGHISPILVAARRRGLRVVDVRQEATAVFAADAVARLTGEPGVAAVTAGPGLTNAITALKNAQLAQSPVLVLGGATATILKGRGSLQDIDQLALVRPHVKLARRVTRVRELGPAVEHALAVARAGVPGPVFLELPLDLLYPETLVRTWYRKESGAGGGSLGARALRWYLKRHLDRQFAPDEPRLAPARASPPRPIAADLRRAAGLLGRSERPVLLVGSQALAEPARADALSRAVSSLEVPVFLSGMARGLLGPEHPLLQRQGRKAALGRADLVLLAGQPLDFRLGYGQHLGRKARIIAANRSLRELYLNRAPDLAVRADPGEFLQALAGRAPLRRPGRAAWLAELRAADLRKPAECLDECQRVDPLATAEALDAVLPDDSVLVVDGGDFAATAAYVLRPRGPLAWLDPGVFGTLGVGAGFALAARLVRPSAEVWLVWGDGAAGYGLIELDTFVRHGLPVIALVGNDGRWAQIARDQEAILGDDVATRFGRGAYHKVADALGAEGILVTTDSQLPAALARAQAAARAGRPALVDVHISTSSFRQGSISM
jgi:acetolactate synthase-1/2/3 large subunit